MLLLCRHQNSMQCPGFFLVRGLLHISVKTELAALLLKIQDYQILLMLRFNFLHPPSVSGRIETRLSQKRSPEREQHKLKNVFTRPTGNAAY